MRNPASSIIHMLVMNCGGIAFCVLMAFSKLAASECVRKYFAFCLTEIDEDGEWILVCFELNEIERWDLVDAHPCFVNHSHAGYELWCCCLGLDGVFKTRSL
ncbi:hypothetical protein CDAR_441481 [Caerostris darwini]|uniref:Secreted protein n=1 Tax=Caerostris darwini TaxID=1538125 RepID=A0AAV4NQ87_9ARAC|nr:hypothetical protein CDAR_441481 [Caerostris darwini]